MTFAPQRLLAITLETAASKWGYQEALSIRARSQGVNFQLKARPVRFGRTHQHSRVECYPSTAVAYLISHHECDGLWVLSVNFLEKWTTTCRNTNVKVSPRDGRLEADLGLACAAFLVLALVSLTRVFCKVRAVTGQPEAAWPLCTSCVLIIIRVHHVLASVVV